MAIIIGSQFDLKATQFNFSRDYFESIELLNKAPITDFPDHFITNVAGTLYQLTKANGVWDDSKNTWTVSPWKKLEFGDKNPLIVDGYVFMGVATPTTNPGTPDQKVFYITNGKGTYTNFGGISIIENEVVILCYDTNWHKLLTGIASQAKLSELQGKINGLNETFNDESYRVYGFYRNRFGVPSQASNQNAFYTTPILVHLGDIVRCKVHINTEAAITEVTQEGGLVGVLVAGTDNELKDYELVVGRDMYISVSSLVKDNNDISVFRKSEFDSIKENIAELNLSLDNINDDVENLDSRTTTIEGALYGVDITRKEQSKTIEEAAKYFNFSDRHVGGKWKYISNPSSSPQIQQYTAYISGEIPANTKFEIRGKNSSAERNCLFLIGSAENVVLAIADRAYTKEDIIEFEFDVPCKVFMNIETEAFDETDGVYIHTREHQESQILKKEDLLETVEPENLISFDDDSFFGTTGNLSGYTIGEHGAEVQNANRSNCGLFLEIKGLINNKSYTIKGINSEAKIDLYRFTSSINDGDRQNISNTTGEFLYTFNNKYGRIVLLLGAAYNKPLVSMSDIILINEGEESIDTIKRTLIGGIDYNNLTYKFAHTFYMHGKELITIGDSECTANIWQKRVAEITGCVFDAEKNTKAGSALSVGGTSMYGSSLEMGLIRVTNIVKEGYTPDYIILENVNDKSAWNDPTNRLGAISDKAHFITNIIYGGETSTWGTSLLSSIPFADRKFGTSIKLTSNVTGKNIKISTMPTKSGNVKLRLHEDAYNYKDYVISVSSTDTLQQILNKILEYDFEWFVDTLDADETGIDFSYHGNKGQSGVNVSLIDTDNTGMTITVTDTNNAKSVSLKHYYGNTLNDSDWINVDNWRDTVKFYEAWKGVIEYCMKNVPKAQLYILVFPHLGEIYPSNYINADGSYNMEAYHSAITKNNSLYEAQRSLAKYYNLPCIDLVENMGVSPANMDAWFPNGNVHPTSEGFMYLGEKIAKIMLGK